MTKEQCRLLYSGTQKFARMVKTYAKQKTSSEPLYERLDLLQEQLERAFVGGEASKLLWVVNEIFDLAKEVQYFADNPQLLN